MTTDNIVLRCSDALPLIPCFLDAELSPPEESDLQTHLQQCQSCQLTYQEQDKLHRFLQQQLQEQRPSLPKSLEKQIHRELRAEERSQTIPWVTRFVTASSALVAVGAICFTAFTLYQDQQNQTNPDAVSTEQLLSSVQSNHIPLARVRNKTKRQRVSFKQPSRLAGSRNYHVGNTPVEHLVYSTNQGDLDVVIAPQHQFRSSLGSKRVVNGRSVWVGRFRDYNVIVVQDLDQMTYSFLSKRLNRTQLYDLVSQSNLLR